MGGYITVAEAIRILDADNSWRQFQVDYPAAVYGRMAIETFRIPNNTRAERIQLEGMERDTGSGVFRRLVETVQGDDGPEKKLWMSDTRAEIAEHYPFFRQLHRSEAQKDKRILVNGLGLGLVVHGALQFSGIGHIDVVEKDPDVIGLVGPLIPDDRIAIHQDDAYTIKWPRGTRWDIAWHDVWPEISDENLPGMNQLMARYKHRVGVQQCWQRKGCLAMARVYRQMNNGTLSRERALAIFLGKAPWLP